MKEYEVDVRKLVNLSIYQLRDVGAKVGVRNPTAMRSKELRDAICAVVTGKVEPYLKAKSGRPHKDVISDDDWDELVGFNSSFGFSNSNNMLSLYSSMSSVHPSKMQGEYMGYVMEMNNELCVIIGEPEDIRLDRYARITDETNNFAFIKTGDKITCTIEPGEDKQLSPIVKDIKTINGAPAESLRTQQEPAENVANDEEFNFKYPQLQFLVDKFPIKKGQRALFMGERGSGQEFLANSIAKDLSKDYQVVYFSGNKNPEYRMQFNNNVEYFFSAFDVLPKNLIFAFEVALLRAKRLSRDYNVVLLVDDVSDMVAFYLDLFKQKNNTADIDKDILQQFKSLYAASKFNSTSSLTIISFASTPEDEEVAEYLTKLDTMVNCHYMLDKQAFVNGKMEFLDENSCHIDMAYRRVE